MKKKINLRESIFIIAGDGIGAGILTIPFLFNKIGIIPLIIIILLAYSLSAVVHTIIAELAVNTKGIQILSTFREHLFTAKNKKVMTIFFFAMIGITIVGNLCAYILGGADIIASFLNIDIIYAKLIFYAVSAIVVLLGIKSIAKSEVVSVLIMILITIIGLFISMNNINNIPKIWNFNSNNYIIAFSLLMFCFSSIFSAFQVPKYIENKEDIKKAIFGGLLINMLVTFFLSVGIVYASETVTEVGIIGWSESVGGIVGILSSLFVLFSLFTSFWMLSFSMANLIIDETRIKFKLSWIIASIIPLVLTIISDSSFIDYIKYVSGGFSIIIIVLLIPSFIKVRKSKNVEKIAPNYYTNKGIIALIILGYILAVVGSFLKVVG